ncbi:MAG: polysaccharide deacetylase family protein, partial [Nitrospirota bacterium]|nr:polysaccharide deacetylase family protein [Nitrospirota bacterium]
TFFMSGKWIAKHDQQVQALLQVPFFEIGTHGEVHAHLPLHSADEQKLESIGPVRLLKTKYHHDATLFRPPYGEFNDDTVNVTRALGLQFILWNVVSGDPDPTITAIQIEDRLKRLVRKGSVIVMHANGKGRHTHEVVQDLQQHLLPEQSLTPMTISDLLACKQAAP